MIEVDTLHRQYGAIKAVRGVSFTVEPGGVTGLLGPNGAGKTTIMKILTGNLFPSSGTVHIDGYSVEDEPLEVKRRIGYLPENAPLYGEMRVDEFLSFIADARFIPRNQRGRHLDAVVTSCGLRRAWKSRIDTLSRGYRQRVGLAQALLHDPPILILDEPTTGLDPNQIVEIRSLVRELGTKKMVLLSTHILQEVEALCSRVLILHEGRIAAQGSPDVISADMGGDDVWHLVLKGADQSVLTSKLPLIGPLATLSGFREKEPGVAELSLSVGFVGSNGETVFDWATVSGCKILSMERSRLSLEAIFQRLTSEGAGK